MSYQLAVQVEHLTGGRAASTQVPDKVPKKKTKKKGSIADSLAVLKASPKTMNLALLVVSYGVSHRLFEFAWKGQLRALYPSAQEYQVRDTVAL